MTINGLGGPRSRYGAAIANLGDLDGDGLGDFAVAAPFEDNGQGVVRLYFGRTDWQFNFQDGRDKRKANVIKSSNSRGFGISFTKNNIDVDNNGLSDLAIGSYLSNEAIVLARLPSVWVEMDLTASITTLNIQNLERESAFVFNDY